MLPHAVTLGILPRSYRRVSMLSLVSAAPLLGGLALLACSNGSSTPNPAIDQGAELDAAAPAIADAASDPLTAAYPVAATAKRNSDRSAGKQQGGNFHLVTDQDRSKITWTARAGGAKYRGQVSLVFGGLYLEEGDLDGASGSISGNLRYIETGKPMWDREISEAFFESIEPGKESADGVVEHIRLEPAVGPGAPRRGEVSVNIAFARGALHARLPIEAVQTAETWQIRSLEPCSLDLDALGYGERLQPLAAALGVDEISPLLTFDFEVHLHPRSPHETARTPP